MPPEILHEIFGHLRNDRLALCNCTLACRTWLLVARPYLFRCLSFDTSLRRVPAIQRIRNNPDIAPLVRVLELKHGADFNALDLPVATAGACPACLCHD